MARARNIKPSFFTNDKLAECEPLARLLFAGLWTIADRAGRLEDRPKKIRAEILPYDDFDCNNLLNQLVKYGFILRYLVGENQYIQILNFEKHQHPHMKESASTIPAPDLHDASIIPVSCESAPILKALYPIPHTESPILKSYKPKPKKKMALEYTDDFLNLWNLYPRRDGSKKDGFEIFIKTLNEGIDYGRIESGVRAYADSIRREGTEQKYIKHFVTWFNKRCWESDYTHAAASQPAQQKSGWLSAADAYIAKHAQPE